MGEPRNGIGAGVFLAKQAMAATGVDFMDVHGDESLPYCFIAGTEGLTGWDDTDQHSLIITGRLAESGLSDAVRLSGEKSG